jgi:ribonuclease P protein component
MPAKSFPFPKSRRLTRASEFEHVKQNGRVQRGRLLMLGVAAGEDELFRAGFITSRAIGRAVARNRVRRRLREIVRKHQHEIFAGLWVVTIARTHSASASFHELEAEWLRLAGRASILAP